MKTLRFHLLLLLSATLPAHPLELFAADSATAAAPYNVATVEYTWHDAGRDRDVPVKIYYPANATAPVPVIIFSHGLGGSREGYSYLGRYWAGHGYVSVHVQHIGSDDSILQGVPLVEILPVMKLAVANLNNVRNRPLDIIFAIDQLTQLNRDDPALKGRLDLDRLGVAGHSFGAFTTLASIGEVFVSPVTGREVSMSDPRIKAAIAMSASPPRLKQNLDAPYAKITVPCFHMTGTRDVSPLGDSTAEERRIPFDHIRGADQFLLTLNGGDHMVFSGRLFAEAGAEKDATFQNLICLGSTAFWDAYLKGDAKAKAWLTGTGFESALKSDGKFEKKLLNAPAKK